MLFRERTRRFLLYLGRSSTPSGQGIVASLARPSGNTTGIAFVDPELDAKRLEILKETFPRLSRVAYLTDSAWHQNYSLRSKAAMEAAARAMSIRLETVDANTPEDLKSAFAEIGRGRVQAIVVQARSPLCLLCNVSESEISRRSIGCPRCTATRYSWKKGDSCRTGRLCGSEA